MKRQKFGIKNFRGGRLLPALIVLFAFLFALFVGSGMSLTSGGLPRAQLSLQTAVLDGPLLEERGIGIYRAKTMAIMFHDVAAPTRTVKLNTTTGPGAKTPVTVHLELVEYNTFGEVRYTPVDSAVMNPAGKYNTAVLKLYSPRGPGSFRLRFEDQIHPFWVTEVTLNESGFAFNWAQFLLVAILGLLVWAAVHYRWYLPLFNRHKIAHRLLVWGTCGLCCLFVLWLMFAITGQGLPHLLPYNPDDTAGLLNNDYYHSQYYHLFDALKHGQVALRTQPSPALAALANPYDAVAREGVEYLWDTAYYNGRYYCYYGPAPMPLYFAFYFVLGRLPGPAVACAVPALIAVVCSAGALQALLRYFRIRANLLLLVLGFPALMAGSMLFMLVACADAYEQPYLWAMAGFAAFVWLFYTALFTKRGVLRKLLFAFAGVGVVCVAASRPAVVLLCVAFAAAPFLRMLRQKGRGIPPKLADVLALALPVLAGAVLLMAYNYVRFASPFNFGNTYQLTVADMRMQTFRVLPVWLLQTLLLFGLWPLQLTPVFPYITIGEGAQHFYGSYFYNYYIMGFANLPLFWALGGMGKTLKGQPAVKKGVYISTIVSGILLLWYTYCVAGAVYRYLTDVSLALGLLALLVLLEIGSCKPAAKHPGLFKAVCVVCVATLLVGFLLCFSNERMAIYRFNTDVFIAVAKLLQIG